MGQVIGSTYEIIERIGAGGGGVVYLARHLRLDKQVVLKADRRRITARPELLRREVDVLKDLSHPYIPQVYDFFSDGETVYTAMDYVDGESLDRALKRGERFSQPQVIRWTEQLLQALEYLHSPTHGTPPRGYVHSDVKPANLMRRANGDVCLIDFNISLALGEENVIGASAGYASPEHYGLDFSFVSQTMTQDEGTLPMDGSTATLTMPQTAASGRRKIIPDVRSDIYSAGATLYHLLSGRRPAKNAIDVAPLTAADGVSPAVADIIQKAMQPLPEDRYQTAEEMLDAFRSLRENDVRAKRLKRRGALTAGVLAALFLVGGLCAFTGLKQMERAQEQGRIAAETARAALAAVAASEDAYRDGDMPRAVRLALEALETAPSSRAQKALTGALGVYDLAEGFQPFRRLELPAPPVKAVLSPEGTRAAAIAGGKLFVFGTERGETLAELAAEPSALADVLFSGENVALYAGEGALRAYDLAKRRELWSGKPATGITLSADGSTAAAVYKDETTAALYDARTGEALGTVEFGERRQSGLGDAFADPEDELFVLSGDGSRLAASFSGGGLAVFGPPGGEDELTVFEDSPYTHFEGGFYGKYFAFSASGEGESVFAVIDMETGEQTGGFSAQNPFRVQADENGIYLSLENLLVRIDPETGEQTERAYPGGDITAFSITENYTMTALGGACAFFNASARWMGQTEGSCDFPRLAGSFALLADRSTPALRLLRLEDHPETRLFAYDPEFTHDEARISTAGNVMLFSYDRFRLYGADGEILAETGIPDAAGVYDQQFRREEDCLEVIYRDGLVRRWSASDGRLLSEAWGEPPDGTLDEKFFTDRLRIEAPVHGTPAAYDRETGELVRELEKEDYLTYVTQTGEYVVTEYVTAQGGRYGLLLDGDCETLAALPGLCDIPEEGTLVFDDMRGTLRASPVYSLQELTALAEKYLTLEEKTE